MRGSIPPGDSMPAWASRLIAMRSAEGRDRPGPAADAVREARAAGTALVGDVTNTLSAYDVLANSDLSAAIFRELIGFRPGDAERILAAAASEIDAVLPLSWLRTSLVPHAPYSVSPALFQAIARAAGDRPVSVHLGESAEEMQFLREGSGPWRDLLGRLGAWHDGWTPPGCGPVEYLDRLGVVSARLLAVHATQLERHEIDRLAAAGATIVTCPRSNQWTGAGTPPIADFFASGVRVAVGTDSLASVEDLNVFGEIAALRRLAPGVPAARLLESATAHGAAALGFGSELGTIEAGKRAELIAVEIPRRVGDDLGNVEEYLTGGVEPPAITWLEAN